MGENAISIVSMVCVFGKLDIIHVLDSIGLDNLYNLLQSILRPYHLSWIQIPDKHLVPVLIKHYMIVSAFKHMVLSSENPHIILHRFVNCHNIIKHGVCQYLILSININRIHELAT